MAKRRLTDRPLFEDIPHWGVVVLESHHSADFTMEWRTHDFIKLLYVLGGKGVIEIDDRVVYFNAGDLLCVPPNYSNRITDAPDAASSLYVCCIATKHFWFDLELTKRLPVGLVAGGQHLSNLAASELRRLRHAQSNDLSDARLTMASGAMRLIERIVKYRHVAGGSPEIGLTETRNADDRERMKNYVDSLATEFYEATTIDDAARSIGMSRRNFTKLFQETAGQSWLTYVRKLSINHARHQLAQTDQSIVSIAFESGFNDLSTFYRQFKSQVGMSPNAYRKSLGG